MGWYSRRRFRWYGQADDGGRSKERQGSPPGHRPPLRAARLSLALQSVAFTLALVVVLMPRSAAAFGEGLDPRFERWLEEVEPIVARSERALFDSLKHDYQRDAFIERFWRVRDPYPETARNEMRERYEERIAYARLNYHSLEDDRSRILAVHGQPSRKVEVRCTTTRIPAIIWAYARSDEVGFGFVVVFVRGDRGRGLARVWRPAFGSRIDGLVRSARACINGSLLGRLVQQLTAEGGEYESKIARVLLKPRPRNLEWVAAFSAETTDLPEDAELFPAELGIEFLGRYQNRTVVQAVVTVDPSVVEVGEFAGHRSYNFLVLGEVLLGDQLFESFRYKFGYPASSERSSLPLPFQRFLRPAKYRLLLKLEDLNGGGFARIERELRVPRLEQLSEIEPASDPETRALFAEATAAVALGDTSIRIVPPADQVHTGLLRLGTLATGDDIHHVSFILDDRLILTKANPPYSVELDLGDFPRRRRLRVEAVGTAGRILAADELELNAAGQGFSVRLVEPRRGTRYHDSLLARADVRVPDGATLDRVELFLNEEQVAVLYQEPFVQPLVLSDSGGLSYVRAVATLSDGNSTEDLVFVNAPEHLEEVEVQFVELYAAVVERDGRPVSGLSRGDFRVREDGVPQVLTRFEKVEDLPIHVGILIDNSASMRGALEMARKAALQFLESAITPRDRAAVITFNRFPNLEVKLTNELRRLGGGLAGLTAEGQTALYDSLMFTLYYFSGISGQRAILLLSDGRDEVSEFTFEETLEYARRAGVAVYSVGLQIPEGGVRRRLGQIAEETGGQSYFIRDLAELVGVYEVIERELRSQYLLAYQSTNTSREDRFRTIEVKVSRPGVRVKTMSGYYP